MCIYPSNNLLLCRSCLYKFHYHKHRQSLRFKISTYLPLQYKGLHSLVFKTKKSQSITKNHFFCKTDLSQSPLKFLTGDCIKYKE